MDTNQAKKQHHPMKRITLPNSIYTIKFLILKEVGRVVLLTCSRFMGVDQLFYLSNYNGGSINNSAAIGHIRENIGGEMNMRQRIIVLLVLAMSVTVSGCESVQGIEPTVPPIPTLSPTLTPDPAIDTFVSSVDGMTLVYVPAGEFIMGSNDYDIDEQPQHTEIVDAFWIDRTEVTQAMYAKCTAPDCKKSVCVYQGDNLPVVCVTWKDANAYCEWAGRRLPTEVEWEKAARGTDGRIYPWGNEPATCNYAVMDDLLGSGNGCGEGNSAWPVGSKPEGISPYGALDMAGNVAEWVADWDPYAFNGAGYVLRGGGYLSIPDTVRAAKREVLHLPVNNYDGLGFRCAVSEEQ
jgi:formylglycine-generating enzyme required for sulfatase activity